MGLVFTVRYYFEHPTGTFSNGDNKITETDFNVQDPDANRFSSELPTLNYYKRVIVNTDGEEKTENSAGTATYHPNGIYFQITGYATGNNRDDDYEEKGYFYFPGTDNLPQIQSCRAIITCRVQNNGQGKILIKDVTNNQDICELTGISNTEESGLDMGAISNLPTSGANFQIQAASDNNKRTHPVYFQLLCNEH